MKPQSVKISRIVHTVETQSRCTINPVVVEDYAERMEAGDKFPPVILFEDPSLPPDQNIFMGDGFHRVAACLKNEYKDVLADVRTGTQLDAIKYSIGANRTNGLCRTNADKRHCVAMALEHFADMTDRAIAELVGVSNNFVSVMRGERNASCHPMTTAPRMGQDGKQYNPAAHRKQKPGAEAPAPAADDTGPAPAETDKPRIVSATPAESKAILDSQSLAAIKALWTQITPADQLPALQFFWPDLSKADKMAFSQWARL